MNSFDIEKLVFESPTSDFYRSIWDIPNLNVPRTKLPVLKRKKYASTPFSCRLYRTENLLVKVAYNDGQPFLIGRHLSDIAREAYGTIGNRPLVALASTHECLEMALWCTTKNILPVIADSDEDITAMLARQYEVDSIVADSATIERIFPALTRCYDMSMVTHVTIVDVVFDLRSLLIKFPSAQIHLTLGLPETGGVAHACPTTLTEGGMTFHESEYYLIDAVDDLTVTHTQMLPTPIINYRPGIAVRFLKKSCSCNALNTFMLDTNS